MSHQNSDIQSVVFERAYWTEDQAKDWLASHGMHPIKHVDLSHPKQYRYRLQDPRKFDHFISKNEPNHIMLVIGFYHPYGAGYGGCSMCGGQSMTGGCNVCGGGFIPLAFVDEEH